MSGIYPRADWDEVARFKKALKPGSPDDIVTAMNAVRPLKHAEYAKMDVRASKRKKLSRAALRKRQRINKKRGRA